MWTCTLLLLHLWILVCLFNFEFCVTSILSRADSNRWPGISVLFERWRIWIIRWQAVGKHHSVPQGAQGKEPDLNAHKSKRIQNEAGVTFFFKWSGYLSSGYFSCVCRCHSHQRSQCSPVACGVPRVTLWTRWLSTAFFLSSLWETGSSLKTWEPVVMRRQLSSLTQRNHWCITPFLKAPGKWQHTELSFNCLFLVLSFFCFIILCSLLTLSLVSYRFEMQEAGISLDNTMKNFSLLPYGS